jgi:hypothetical protein
MGNIGQDKQSKISTVNWHPLFYALIFFYLIIDLNGCIYIPIKSGETSRRISETDLKFIKLGETSKSNIKKHFGHPEIFWEDQNVFVYKWKKVIGVVAGISYEVIPMPVAAKVTGFMTLLIQFNKEDRVKNFEIKRVGSFDSYGDHLIRWVNENKNKGTSN